jgi:6-phosphofructokinase 1
MLFLVAHSVGGFCSSFGFNTAVDEARKAINSAVVESQCTPFGIGIVKLMGRHAGYISAHATLASRSAAIAPVRTCVRPEPSSLLSVQESRFVSHSRGSVPDDWE